MIISRAPVRISFFGGGTDYPEYFSKEGGAVLATAINKYCYITASPFLSHLFDYSVRVSYRRVELARNLEEIEHRVFRECLKLCDLHKDLELHTIADLPAFTGMGSSSTFTVALLHALYSFKGQFLAANELARQAIYIERHVLGENVGCQDQVMAAFGGLNVVEFRSETDFAVRRVFLPPDRLVNFERHLCLVFTGIKRRASDVVAPQLRKVAENRSVLTSMYQMVWRGLSILTTDTSLQAFGELLNEGWHAKRSLDGGVSSPEIDALYEKGMRAGAWGGKLLGAGGGGFMLFFAPPERHPTIAEAFPGHRLLNVSINAPGSQIIFSA